MRISALVRSGRRRQLGRALFLCRVTALLGLSAGLVGGCELPPLSVVACFTYEPQSPAAGQSIAFNASCSSSHSGVINTYAWDFGDGTTAQGMTASRSFTTQAVYRVRLTVTGSNHTSGTTEESISVGLPRNIAPTASFTFSPTSPTKSDTVSFTDLSTDLDGSVVAWSWDFGDGGTSTLQNPTHKYSQAQSYTVALTVTDDDGAKGTATKGASVGDSATVRVSSSPNPVTIPVGGNALVTYTFRNDGTCSVTFTQILAAYFSPDGQRLTEDVTMAYSLNVPGPGTVLWVDYTYLPPTVASAAESAGATSAVLRETFVGVDCTGGAVRVTDELTVGFQTVQYQVSVNSWTCAWQNSGISVAAGDTLAFTASGQVVHWKSQDGTQKAYCGPEGSGRGACDDPEEPCCLAPGLANNALVAKIGSSAPFYVGARMNMVASAPGTLYLGMNETAFCGGCADNEGSWAVTIVVGRDRIPENRSTEWVNLHLIGI